MGKVSEWVIRMRGACKVWDARRHWIEHRCVYGVKNFCDGRANNTGIDQKNERIQDREPCKYFINGECTKRKDESNETNC